MDLDDLARPLLDRLTDDQRAAATAPPGPILCVAPAGSGKTTTLVARVAWLVAGGVPPRSICALTFNRRAAEELSARLGAALAPLGAEADAVRVRTFHALGLEILRSAGREVRVAPRDGVLRRLRPDLPPAVRMRVDTAFSRLKLEACVTAEDVAADPEPGPLGRLFLDYAAALAEQDSLDFDDLVAESLRLLRSSPSLLDRWRRDCVELLVDEVQDVDRSQLELALVLAAPANRIFLVGDDDQCIYAWRLADVRRVLRLAARLPGLERVDLTTNFRCPRPVVERAVRLVEHNAERFEKTIRARPQAVGSLVLASDDDPDDIRFGRVLASWPQDDSTRAILTRTNRDLLPAVAAAVDADLPFRVERLELLLEHPELDAFLDTAATTAPGLPLLRRLAAVRPGDTPTHPPTAGRPEGAEGPGLPVDAPTASGAPALADGAPALADGAPALADGAPALADGAPALADAADLRRAILAWAAPFSDLATLAAAVRSSRERLRVLRRQDAALTLSTAHATKGLEFDHVAVVMDAHRFPSARTLAEAEDPDRALEEERRLAYVAWTRARRSLTLVYDRAAPSRFLLEAFDADELAVTGGEAP